MCVLDIGVWGKLSAAGLIGGVGRRLHVEVVPSAEKVPEVCALDIGVWGTLSAAGAMVSVQSTRQDQLDHASKASDVPRVTITAEHTFKLKRWWVQDAGGWV